MTDQHLQEWWDSLVMVEGRDDLRLVAEPDCGGNSVIEVRWEAARAIWYAYIKDRDDRRAIEILK